VTETFSLRPAAVASLAGAAEPLARLARAIAHVPWFAAAGERLTDADKGEAEAYLAALDLGSAEIAGAAGWFAAKAIAASPEWDPRWWEAEETLRHALLREAGAVLPAGAVLSAITRVTDSASDVVLGAASTALARAGIADAALARVAAGAATQACYQAALALAANAGPRHAFAIKFRLFEAGRWPLGLLGGAFHLL